METVALTILAFAAGAGSFAAYASLSHRLHALSYRLDLLEKSTQTPPNAI